MMRRERRTVGQPEPITVTPYINLTPRKSRRPGGRRLGDTAVNRLYFHIAYRPSHQVVVPRHRVNASTLQVED
jgi:hypothetical protein